MAYDEGLADRVRVALADVDGVTEQRMFGGLSFLLDGKMCCGVAGDDLVVRVGPDQYEDALAEPGARPMDFTGRPTRGLVYVDRRGYASDEALAGWVQRGVGFAATLEAK